MIKTRTEALKVLGLKADAGVIQIKAAYKELVKKCHPDSTGINDTTVYNRITEAYHFLMSESKGKTVSYSKVMGKSENRKPASNAEYAAFQKRAAMQKKRRAQEFEEKQKEYSANYAKQEADYKRAMDAINAIRVARAIESIVWAKEIGKDKKNEEN